MSEPDVHAPGPADHAAPEPTQDAAAFAKVERENTDLKDRLLRALAEMENLRRRTERDIQDARAFSITRFASDVIATADNLRRTLESLPKAKEGEDEPDFSIVKPMIEGVELTERELLKALEKHGVKKRAPVGEKFDPHRDQAMFEIPDETVPGGTVLQVVQAGYLIGERVLRPAMVGVSKGGPARAADPAGEAKSEVPVGQPASPEAPRPKFDKRA